MFATTALSLQYRSVSPDTRRTLETVNKSIDAISNDLNSGRRHIADVGDEINHTMRATFNIFKTKHRIELRNAGILREEKKVGDEFSEPLEKFSFDKVDRVSSEIAKKEFLGQELTGLDRAVLSLQISQNGAALLDSVSNRWKETWKGTRKIYNSTNNSLYPIRDLCGQTIRVTQVSTVSTGSQSNKLYSSEQVKPFISSKRTPEERAALYKNLSCRKFEEKHKKSENEAGLVGQDMVVATELIPTGTCLGVYGGMIVPKEKLGYIVDDTYALNISDDRAYVIDGDNILAKINTNFDYIDGRPFRQSADGYNVEIASFDAKLENGAKIRLMSAFSLTEIKPEADELRLDYGYGSAEIKLKFSDKK